MATKNRAYNPMFDDGYDNKTPLHDDEDFQHGIQFKVKFIGSLEVAKPTSRAEIVASMRRIRYEFKARSIKKRPVKLLISVEGIKVSLGKKNKRKRYYEEGKTVLMNYPIYRVFYVSHDSQDLKIFSFIARDHNTNTFRCNVFKAYKKNEAIHIVRTIGQAFEVCHKLSVEQTMDNNNSTGNPCQKDNKTYSTNRIRTEKTERYLESVQIPISSVNVETNRASLLPSHSTSEFTLKHQMQFMQEQLQQMQNESELAFNQIKLIKEQLNIEIASRIDLQNKNKLLVERNRKLLTHIQQLLLYTRDLETKLNYRINDETFKNLPSLFSTLNTNDTSNQPDFSSHSPDSGKGKEISSESISDAFISTITDQKLNNSWSNNNNNNNNCISIIDDLTTRSISINETIPKTDNNTEYEQYSSTSSSTCSSIRASNKNPIEHYIYDHIIPTTTASSFTNSAFTPSPLRTMNN